MKLSAKQERFCQEYVKDLNATQAAIRAGYAENSAQEQSSRLLSKDMIKARLGQLKAAQAKRLEIDADTILRELLTLATVDIAEALDDMGGVKPLKDIPPQVRRAISSLEIHEIFDGDGDEKHAIGLARKIRFWDKTRALEMLGKHLKLFADRVELSGRDGKPIETKDVSKLPDEELNARIAAMLAKGEKPQ